MHTVDSQSAFDAQLDSNAAAPAAFNSPNQTLCPVNRTNSLNGLGLVASGVEGISMTGCGLVVHNEEITPAEFNTIFRNVLTLHKSSCWLLGDTLLLGEKRWGSRVSGSKYEEAMAVTGLSRSTLRNIVLTCSRFPVETRHPELSFTHHQEVANTDADPDQRAAVLEQAASEKMSCAALRKHLHLTRFSEPEEPEVPEKVEAKADTRSDIESHFIDPENPLSIINLPERVSPDAPPLWDAYKFVGWAAQQDPEDYDLAQCEEALKISEPIAEFCEAVKERIRELTDPETAENPETA